MSASPLRSPAFVVSAALLLISAAALSAAVSGLRYHLRKKPIEVALKVSSIPTRTPTWSQVGKDAQLPQAVVDELGTTNYLTRIYRRNPSPGSKSSPQLELHLAYYTGMVDTVPHIPERCMVGGGWDIVSSPGVTPIPFDSARWPPDEGASTPERPVLRARLASGLHTRLPSGIDHAEILVTEFSKPPAEGRLYSGYFFIANGGICASAEGVRLLAFDLKSEYAFYLKVQVSSFEVSSAGELAAQAASLLGELLPEIMLCVPDWTEVERGNYPPRSGGVRAAGVPAGPGIRPTPAGTVAAAGATVR